MNTSCRPCSGPSRAQVCNGMQRHLTVCDGVCDGVLGAISRTGTVSLFPIQLHRHKPSQTVTNRHKPVQTVTYRYTCRQAPSASFRFSSMRSCSVSLPRSSRPLAASSPRGSSEPTRYAARSRPHRHVPLHNVTARSRSPRPPGYGADLRCARRATLTATVACAVTYRYSPHDCDRYMYRYIPLQRSRSRPTLATGQVVSPLPFTWRQLPFHTVARTVTHPVTHTVTHPVTHSVTHPVTSRYSWTISPRSSRATAGSTTASTAS